jgi:hypothetical protein
LFWCGKDGHKNETNGHKIPVPVNATKEQLSQPFLLVSRASNVPNLQAADIFLTGIQLKAVYCLLFKNEIDQIERNITERLGHVDEIDQFEKEVDVYNN